MNNRSDRVQRPFERQGPPSCSPVTPLGAIEAASLRRGHHNHYIVDGDRVMRGAGAVRGCLNAPYARSSKRGFDHQARRAACFPRLICCLGPRWDRHSPQILHRKSKREEIGRSVAGGSCIESRKCISRALYRDRLGEKRRRYARWSLLTKDATPGPKALFGARAKSEPHPHPPPGPHPPVRHRAHQPGGAGGPKRCGRLGATPGDAPVASTPPRRREPGPVSAFRRSRRTISRGGCQLNGKMAVKRIFARGIRILDLGDNVNGLQRP